MKNFIILLIASIVFASCNSISGNGNVRNEQRNVSGFHGVKSSGSIDVEIKNGNNYSVTVEDDDNLFPYIVTEVENGVLNIHYKDNTSISNDHAKVYVTAPALSEISVSGSGDIAADNVIKSTDQIQFNTSGSGDIKATVDAPAIKATGSGSGDISLSGNTKDFDCRMTGSGDINCNNLKSENTTVHVSGSSTVHVFASVSLKVNVAGSGDVFYSGNPPSPEIHIAGSGTVQAEK
jgi:hypothetical protein